MKGRRVNNQDAKQPQQRPRHSIAMEPSSAATASTSTSAPLTPEHRVVEFLRRSQRSNSHWRPSMAMAKCLGVPQHKLQLTASKDDTTNLVWVSVVVLIYCTMQLADLHEIWYELADTSTAWLYQQPHFVENREDLVHSACTLLNVRDVSSILESVFPEPKDPETEALEQALGDWKIGYLDEPPYSMYYWNEKTNLSTWRNPLETAQQEKEKREKKAQREALLARVLPMRVKINRDVLAPAELANRRMCDVCAPKRQEATVMCVACDRKYFCEQCCDTVHCTRDKLAHIDTSFRYRECIGITGFPKAAR